jgi:hypothetical protein
MYLFKENKFVSNIGVINMDIEKRTYKEMAESFGMSKRYMFFIFVDDILSLNVDILTIYSPGCFNPSGCSQRLDQKLHFLLHLSYFCITV